MKNIKKVFLAVCLVIFSSVFFVACNNTPPSTEISDTITVKLYIDGDEYTTMETSSDDDFLISPNTPIWNDTSDMKYFDGWYIDNSFNIPYKEGQKFKQNAVLYGRWIGVYFESFTYTVNENKATITGYSRTTDTIIVVPSHINSFPITQIGSDAFKNHTMLNKVIFDAETVEKIGNNAFSGCNSLEEIKLPTSVKEIGDAAFQNCSLLKSVVMSETTEKIGVSAFDGCVSLTSITIPSSVTSMGNNAFSGCSNLNKININSLEAWCNINFAGSTSNPLYYAKNLYLDNVLITELSIPNTVSQIKKHTFYNCTSLTSITFPNSVTSIDFSAFAGCSSLNKLNITSLEAWYNTSFANSTSNPLYYAKNLYLDNVLVTELSIPNTVTSIKNYTFYNCSSLTSITIPEGVKDIGSSAFNGCTKLEMINFNATNMSNLSYANNVFSYAGTSSTGIILNIGANVTKMPAYLFNPYESSYAPKIITINFNATNMNNLADQNNVFSYVGINGTGITVNIGANVTKIPAYLFNPHSSPSVAVKIIEVNFAENSICESVGSSAFENCISLTSITFPDSVTIIGSSAFYGCSNLTNINIEREDTTIGLYAFHYTAWFNAQSNGVIYVGKALYIYKGSMESNTTIIIRDDTHTITSIAFSRLIGSLTGLTNIIIPKSVTIIGSSAFDNCSNLTNIYYLGSTEDWQSITIDANNSNLISATKYYYIENEEDVPDDGGNYWHYDEDGITPIIWSI
ncbi:MAG: leucine-rich repeat domain-containing protein [Clostridia bacterium]|nr:leucine-rich repeat domain-containing protein [Clostridia bacterium]